VSVFSSSFQMLCFFIPLMSNSIAGRSPSLIFLVYRLVPFTPAPPDVSPLLCHPPPPPLSPPLCSTFSFRCLKRWFFEVRFQLGLIASRLVPFPTSIFSELALNVPPFKLSLVVLRCSPSAVPRLFFPPYSIYQFCWNLPSYFPVTY